MTSVAHLTFPMNCRGDDPRTTQPSGAHRRVAILPLVYPEGCLGWCDLDPS